MRDYREKVVEYLLDGYARGLTPNPDIMCNREIKFGVFRAWALEHGFTAVATGHYARRRIGRRTGPSRCSKGADRNKDQTYFLALLGQDQLRDARFPVGDLEKPELRRIAREAGPGHGGQEGQPGDLLHRRGADGGLPAGLRPRPARSRSSAPATAGSSGATAGLHYYTLGQRRGIGVPSNADNERYVVVGKRAADNALLVAFDHPDAPGLFQSEVRVHSLSWTGASGGAGARARGSGPLPRPPGAAALHARGRRRRALVRFEQPQRALAAGPGARPL